MIAVDRARRRPPVRDSTGASMTVQRDETPSGTIRERDDRPLELELAAEAAVPLQRQVELGEPDRRLPQLVLAEVLRLTEGVLGGERMHLQLGGGVARPDALRRERVAGADPGDVVA